MAYALIALMAAAAIAILAYRSHNRADRKIYRQRLREEEQGEERMRDL